MTVYHKIQTVWDRDPENNNKTLIEGRWSRHEFAWMRNLDWVWTEKVDGTNIRLILDSDGRTRIGGKTDNAQIHSTLLERLDDALHELDGVFAEGAAVVYGEGYGSKIQGGGNYKSDGVDFVVFDVKVGDIWLERENVMDVAGKLGFGTVPIVGRGPLEKAIELVRDGFKSNWGDFQAEGLVVRPPMDLFNRKGERVITKIKSKDFR